jgi:hypothetical protein
VAVGVGERRMTVTYDQKRDRFYVMMGETEYGMSPKAMESLYQEIQDALYSRRESMDVKR